LDSISPQQSSLLRSSLIIKVKALSATSAMQAYGKLQDAAT